MSSPEYIAEAKAYLSSMSEHDLEDSGDEFQRLFGYAMELSLALTARDEALACIRVFAQDCIENGHFDRGALGNLYSIRDLCDSKGENLK